MSQHTNKEVWAFLRLLVDTVEHEKAIQSSPLKSIEIQMESKEDTLLFRNTISLNRQQVEERKE
jgi:hypothetical protein